MVRGCDYSVRWDLHHHQLAEIRTTQVAASYARSSSVGAGIGAGVRPTPGISPRAVGIRWRYAIGALLAGVLLVVGIVQITGGGATDPWATAEGANMRAGFLNGCGQSAGNLVDCQCVFAHVTSRPPFNTPQGFASLGSDVLAYERTGDRVAIPAVYISSLRACRVRS